MQVRECQPLKPLKTVEKLSENGLKQGKANDLKRQLNALISHLKHDSKQILY